MEYMTFSEKKDKSYKKYSMELAGRTLTVDIGRVAGERCCADALWGHDGTLYRDCIRKTKGWY